MPTQPEFFRSPDLASFQHRLQTNHRYNSHDLAEQEFARHLKASIFAKTIYWTHQVALRLPADRYTQVARQQWEQRHFLRRYSWGRFFLNDYTDKGFYFTLGVDSGESTRARSYAAQGLTPAGPALIMKLDVHRANASSLTAEEQVKRASGEAILNSLPITTRWRRIGLEELPTYNWNRLIEESIDFINQHEEDLRRIWAASGSIDTRKPSVATLGPGKTVRLTTGKTPTVSPPREVEANDEHRRLSNLLQELLPSYDFTGVERSCSISYSNSNKVNNEVDLKAVDAEGRVTFFEIKALQAVDKCIREALGQLLEYAYWAAPTPSLATRLVIATAHSLTPDAQQYLHRLRTGLSLPINHVRIDLANKKLHFT